MRRLKDFKLKSKKVLVRCDFNVPLSEKGKILDDFRIRVTIPTIKYLIKNRAKIILISHLGRPEDRDKRYSLKPIAEKLERILKKEIKFLGDCIGEKVEKEIDRLKEGEIVLLENLRFYKEEEKDNKNFTKSLAQLGDIYINEAFSVCHRNHASVVGITKYLPSGAGFLLEKEIKALSKILKNPKKPLVVIIGGKKVQDKAKVTEKFSQFADWLIIGNLVAEEIKRKKLKIKNLNKVIFPIKDGKFFDLDEKTIENFKTIILKAKTIFWAGPLGKIEERKYQKGTREIAKAVIKSKAFSVVGGGDTIEFLNKINLSKKFDHVSIGGGAMLKFLSGEKLLGIESLN